MKHTMHRRHPTEGFTLIELLICLVIIAILMSIAIPQYTQQVAKAHRANARTQLLGAAQFMQRFYAANDRYDIDRAGAPAATQMPVALHRAPQDGTQLYVLNITAQANSYILTMSPLNNASMAADKCGSYTLSDSDVKGNIMDTKILSKKERDACWH
jgi:type IV pilus assembly protein PilE